MDNISTQTKIMTAYGCKGQVFHVIAGVALLQSGKGYECPYCHAEVYDISDTPIGKEYLRFARVDLHAPPPLRTVFR